MREINLAHPKRIFIQLKIVCKPFIKKRKKKKIVYKLYIKQPTLSPEAKQ